VRAKSSRFNKTRVAPALHNLSVMLRMSLVALMVSAGCDLGTVPITGGPNPTPGVDAGSMPQGMTAQQNFTANVYPIIQPKCGGCHGGQVPAFSAATAAASYALIVALPAVVGTFDPATAPILTTIAAGHKGVTYATVESSAISAWLSAEKAAGR